MPSKPVRLVAAALVCAALIIAGVAFVYRAQQAGAPEPVAAGEIALPPGVSLGGAFTLVNQDSQPVSDADFRGKWTLLYFGYSFCPDVCPTELQTMAGALDALPPELASKVQPVFVTVDPARDTPAHLKDYVALFHPRLEGLTGTPDQIAAIARAYRVYYAKAKGGGTTDYLMDHSSFVYLVGPDGKPRALFRPEASADDMASSLRRRLS